MLDQLMDEHSINHRNELVDSCVLSLRFLRNCYTEKPPPGVLLSNDSLGKPIER
jgi:hypothetical protein